MTTSYFTLVFASLSLLSIISAEHHLELALEDNFDTFDLKRWQHEITMAGGGNWEFEMYVNNRSNSFVRDGVLYLKPTLLEDEIGIENVKGNGYTIDLWGSSPADYCTWADNYGCKRTAGGGGNYLDPIKSARVRTVKSFSFQYGKVEIRAKLPRGDWLWPAIWMLPKHDPYGLWPSSGEIDIMESRGNSPDYPAGGYDQFGSTLHWGIDYFNNFYPKTHEEKKVDDLATSFHTYGLIWNETYMGTYLDDESNVVLSVPITQSFWSWTELSDHWDNPWKGRGNNAPFDQEFYLVFNVACGGTGGYFPDGMGNKPWTDASANAVNEFYDAKSTWYETWDGDNAAMQIDSVKVWTYKR